MRGRIQKIFFAFTSSRNSVSYNMHIRLIWPFGGALEPKNAKLLICSLALPRDQNSLNFRWARRQIISFHLTYNSWWLRHWLRNNEANRILNFQEVFSCFCVGGSTHDHENGIKMISRWFCIVWAMNLKKCRIRPKKSQSYQYNASNQMIQWKIVLTFRRRSRNVDFLL